MERERKRAGGLNAHPSLPLNFTFKFVAFLARFVPIFFLFACVWAMNAGETRHQLERLRECECSVYDITHSIPLNAEHGVKWKRERGEVDHVKSWSSRLLQPDKAAAAAVIVAGARETAPQSLSLSRSFASLFLFSLTPHFPRVLICSSYSHLSLSLPSFSNSICTRRDDSRTPVADAASVSAFCSLSYRSWRKPNLIFFFTSLTWRALFHLLVLIGTHPLLSLYLSIYVSHQFCSISVCRSWRGKAKPLTRVSSMLLVRFGPRKEDEPFGKEQAVKIPFNFVSPFFPLFFSLSHLNNW